MLQLVRYCFRAKGGLISVMQAGRGPLWRLRFGDEAGTEFNSPEDALFALGNRTARLPAGTSFGDWRAPAALSSWKRDLVDDLPPRDPSSDPDEW